MNKEEIENEADGYITMLQSMEAAGIITYVLRKNLSGKVKAWLYDRKKEMDTEIKV